MATRTGWLICVSDDGRRFTMRPTGQIRQPVQHPVNVLVTEHGAAPLDAGHYGGDGSTDVVHLDSFRRRTL